MSFIFTPKINIKIEIELKTQRDLKIDLAYKTLAKIKTEISSKPADIKRAPRYHYLGAKSKRYLQFIMLN